MYYYLCCNNIGSMVVTYKFIHSYLWLINHYMSDINLFCTYLDVAKWYKNTTIERHKSYLIYYLLFLLENNLSHNYDSIRKWKHDLMFYVSQNTVNKRISTICTYSKYRNLLHDDYSIRPERIENVRYMRG